MTLAYKNYQMKRKLFLLFISLYLLILTVGCLKSDSAVLGNIKGKIFDINGKVLAGVKVEVYSENNSTISDELGRYVLYNLTPGQKKIIATYQNKAVAKVFNIPRGSTLENADIVFDALDVLPPVITDVKVNEITENSAQITWLTNEPATTIVDYATGAIGLSNYIYQASDSALVTTHTITLTNLLPNTLYRFRVRSLDYYGNEGISSDYQFSTLAGDPPAQVEEFSIDPPTQMEVVVLRWKSNEESDLAGYYVYRSESKNGPFVRINANPIPSATGTTVYEDRGLKIAQKYYYYVRAVDIAGNQGAPSEVRSIVTPGILAENRIWKAEESPYILMGDIRIRPAIVLQIEPGVEIKLSLKDYLPDVNGATMTEIIVQGALYAVGNANNKIIFTSAESFPTKANWGGIKFIGTNDPQNQLKFATILFADIGIKSEGSTPLIENCEFGLCGVGLDIGLSSALNIKFNTFRDCDIGLLTANSNIRNNLFIKNQVGVGIMGSDRFEYNTIDCLVGIEIHNGEPVISNNIISYVGNIKGLYGINQVQPTATPTITYNDIWNYAILTNNLTVATGPGNISVDPLFIGGFPFSYRLQTVSEGYASDSPCITAGEGGTQMGRYGP